MLAALWAIVLVQSALLLLLAFLVVGLVRRAVPALERLDAASARGGRSELVESGLPPGSVVPPFTVQEPGGRPVISAEIFAASRAVVLFLSAHCEPCQQLSSELARDSWKESAQLVVVQAIHDPDDLLPVPPGARVLVQSEDFPALAAFGSNISPHAFLVDQSARIVSSAIPHTAAELRQLARHGADSTSGPGRAAAERGGSGTSRDGDRARHASDTVTNSRPDKLSPH